MSGPKVSVYSLTPAARTNLDGQRRCDRQSFECAKQIRNMLVELQKTLDESEQLSVNLELSGSQAGTAALQNTVQWRKDREQYCALMTGLTPNPSNQYTVSEEALAQKQSLLARLQQLKAAVHHIRQECDKQTEAMRADNPTAQNRIRAKIAEGVAGVSETDWLVQETETTALKTALTEELNGYLSDRRLSGTLHSEIRGLCESLVHISDLPHLKSFSSITGERIRREVQSCLELREAYEEAELRYAALCEMAGETVQPWPITADGLEKIREECQRIETAMVQQQIQGYISASVDEVMSDMGYDLIGTRNVRKKSGKHFENRLFTFREGCAVNVTFSSEGQIALELGGIVREDRIPSDEETAALTQEMETFCGEFAEFERRLLAKGIVVGDRISLLPPSPAYASVININDYDLSADAQFSEMQQRRQPDKSRKKSYISEE